MKDGVSKIQLFFIIVISALGFGAMEIPRIMGDTAGTGAWLTLLIAAAFFSIDVFIIVFLGYAHKGESLAEYSQFLAGKTVTYFFEVIYIAYFIAMLTFIARSAADIIKNEILINTPIWATMLLILTISLYAASKGLTNIGRIVEYLGFIVLIITFILCSINFTQGNILNIMPLFDPSEKGNYFNALPSAIFCFLGFEVITIIPFSDSNGKRAFGTAIFSIIALYFILILIVESCYSILGVDDVVNYDYPLFVAIRRLDITILQFAKRLDLFFIMAWLTSVFCSVSMFSFTAAEYTKKLFSKDKANLILIIIGILAFCSGMLLPNAEEESKLFVQFTIWFGLIPAFIIPFILFIIHLCKSGKRPYGGE